MENMISEIKYLQCISPLSGIDIRPFVFSEMLRRGSELCGRKPLYEEIITKLQISEHGESYAILCLGTA